MSGTNDIGYGQQTPDDSGSDIQNIAFQVRQMIARLDTMKLVKVMAVTGGGVAPAGTVDVLPLVQQIDGNGNGVPHGTVYGLPWSRVQGGKNAIICDPEVNDIGYVICSDRDITKVKNTQAQALPGSRRQYNISDGIYAGGCLNVAPEQYIIFTTTGIRLVDINGNSVATTSTGMTLSDVNGNEIIMGAGFVNIVTPVLQVNGVPVTVP
jgi:hypothetical protein